MKLTTLCYIEQEGNYLMLHRTKKENDPNHARWIGIGGKFEANESPEDCLLREVKEETGLTLMNFTFRGIITFVSDEWETEYMHLFTATEFQGDLTDCVEGDLQWVKKEDVLNLNLWEGDRVFLNQLLISKEFFSLKLVYQGEKLVNTVLY